jgi:hypothetical protein
MSGKERSDPIGAPAMRPVPDGRVVREPPPAGPDEVKAHHPPIAQPATGARPAPAPVKPGE